MRHMTRSEMDQVYNSILGERLPNVAAQLPYTESVTPHYKIGSRLWTPYGIWHYCKCGANAVVNPYWDRGMVSVVVPETRAVIGATAVGAVTVVIDDADATHGADYWANGKAEFWASVAPATFQHRKIKSSTASNGTSVTLTLYRPLTNALANGDGLEICRSQYAEVDETVAVASSTKMSIACVPHMLVTAQYYFWGLTWGMCTLAATIGTMGNTASSRQVYFNHNDGTILTEEEAGFVAGAQPAGYLLPDSNGGAQTIFMLQLDP